MSSFKSAHNEIKETQKIIYINAVILTVVILWDIFALAISPSITYFGIKLLFIISPILIWNQLATKGYKDLAAFLILIIFFTYSYYYMTTLHFSYYTSFFQYFMGGAVAFRLKKSLFYSAYLIGLLLLILATLYMTHHHLAPSKTFTQEVLTPAILIWCFSIWWYEAILSARYRAEEKERIFIELGQMSSFLIHELNSPIARLSNKSHLQQEAANDLKKISTILSLTKAFVQKQSSFPIGHVNPKRIIEQIVKKFEKSLSILGIEIQKDIEDHGFYSQIDFLEIILNNLFTNAVEYLSDNSKISQKMIIINGHTDENHYVFRFSNPVYNISNKNLKKMFEPMYSTKTTHTKNQGLGLFIAKKISHTAKWQLTNYIKNNFIVFELKLYLK